MSAPAPRLRPGLRPGAPARSDHGLPSLAEAEALLRDMGRALSTPASRQPQPESPPQPVEPVESVALVVTTAAGTIRSFDETAERIFGIPAADALRRPLKTILDGADGRSPSHTALGRRADGTIFVAAVDSTALDVSGERLRVLAIRDLARRLAVEEQQRKTEARYRSLLEQIPAVTFMASLNDDATDFYVSPQIEALLGFTQEEWLASPFLWFQQLHPDDRERCHEEFARGCLTGGPFRAEFRALTRHGGVVWVHGEARLVRDEQGRPFFIQGIAYDITDLKRAEETVRESAEQIRASLKEKEILLEEIHHRVKNNLQVISSLLKLQAGQVRDAEALELFLESRHRIHSMALVHEKLYQSADLSRVDFAEYVASLADLLFRAYGDRSTRVRLDTSIESVHLPIDVAVPLGLILNELVTNCLKYAFPEGRRGTIRISLRPSGNDYALVVADDGVGMPAGFDPERSASLGLSLVTTLARQLGGSVVTDPAGRSGARFHVRFPREELP